MKRYKDSDLFSVHFQNEDVQDCDVRWDQALLSASDMPPDVILEDFTSQNYRTLFSFRPFWLCTIKKPFKIMDRQVIYD